MWLCKPHIYTHTHKMPPTVIHPIFKECEKFVVDTYWRHIFESCALNKFPKGVRYTIGASSSKDEGFNHIFSIKTIVKGRQKVEVVSLPSDPEELSVALLVIFKEKLGMYSTIDLKVKNDEMDDVLSRFSVDDKCTWKQLKPKTLKDGKIRDYIIGLAKKHSLTPKQARVLLAEINLAFQLKTISPESVDYRDGKIQSLKGVEISEGRLKGNLTRCSVFPKHTRKDGVKKVTKIDQHTDKFCRMQKARYDNISEML